MDIYDEFNNEEKYMNNLTFYGFVTLKNKLKGNVVYCLNDLKKFNINFKITTGDDIYNTLSNILFKFLEGLEFLSVVVFSLLLSLSLSFSIFLL